MQILSKNTCKQIQVHIKKTPATMTGWFNMDMSINVVKHINRCKDKNHMIILIDAEKTFDKIQYGCIMKGLKKKWPEGL